MKKELLLIFLVIFCTSYTFAQINSKEYQNYDRKISENYHPNDNNKSGGGWFNFGKK